MAFISYAVQTAVLMGIFCAVYHLFFRRLTFFTINRYFLISSLMLSLAIPLVKVEVKDLTIQEPISELNEVYYTRIHENIFPDDNARMDAATSPDSPPGWSFNLRTVFSAGYFIISGFLLLRLLFAASILIKKARSGTKSNGFIWIEPFDRFNNCSFFNLLVIDKTQLSEVELEQILSHENEHKLRLHSLDQLFIEFLQVFFWFNPFIYYYKRAINAVHEYEVDQKLCARIDKQTYGNLLLKLAAPSHTTLMRGFSQNSLKTRIQFLFGKRSKRYKKAGYALLAPLVALLVSIFSFQKAEAIGVMIHFPLPLSTKAERPEVRPDSKGSKDNTVFKDRDITVRASLLKLADIIQPLFSREVSISNLMEGFPEEAELPKLTVVLDPGHGGTDSGTSFEENTEKDIVLNIARNIKEVLESQGFNVVLTRDADEAISLRDRVLVKGDVFVSLHVNSSVRKESETAMKGMEIFIPSKHQVKDTVLLKRSLLLASCLKTGLSSLDIPMRDGLKEGGLFVLNNNPNPSVLLELGYINNLKEAKLLLESSYCLKFAGELAKALKKYQTAKYSYVPNPATLNDIHFSANDSVIFNTSLNRIKLYGKAKVKSNYGEISADNIIFNLKTGKGKAEGNTRP